MIHFTCFIYHFADSTYYGGCQEHETDIRKKASFQAVSITND